MKKLKKIAFSGNAASMNYTIVKQLREKTDYRPDLFLLDYNSIMDHPAWEDVSVKIAQSIIRENPTEAKLRLNNAIKESKWNKPSWIKEKPINYSTYDKFLTKYVDNFHIIKKQIKHYVKHLINYDFIFTEGMGSISAMLAKVPYAIRPYGSDLAINTLEDNYRGKLMRKAFSNCNAIFMQRDTQMIEKLGLKEKLRPAAVVIDTEKLTPKKEKMNKKTEFFLASKISFSEKRTDYAIRAFARILQSYDAHLYCLEFGNDVQKALSLVKSLGIDNNVTFYPFIASKPVLASLYNKHDAIIGSLNTRFGITELEAMACDKPVIAYTKTVNELEKQLPILNSFSEDEIYENMKKVCDGKNLPKSLRDFIINHFGLQSFLNEFEYVLDSI